MSLPVKQLPAFSHPKTKLQLNEGNTLQQVQQLNDSI
jgi:hypothetical protein